MFLESHVSFIHVSGRHSKSDWTVERPESNRKVGGGERGWVIRAIICLALYNLMSVCIFSILFSRHFLRWYKENLFNNQELLLISWWLFPLFSGLIGDINSFADEIRKSKWLFLWCTTPVGINCCWFSELWCCSNIHYRFNRLQTKWLWTVWTLLLSLLISQLVDQVSSCLNFVHPKFWCHLWSITEPMDCNAESIS